jgi:hypothetical protein
LKTSFKTINKTARYFVVVYSAFTSFDISAQDPKRSVVFEKYPVASEAFESVNVFDVDKDGVVDLVSGSFWYKGPDFIRRKFIGPIKRTNEYYENFSAIVWDLNNDGNKDIIDGGWFEGKLIWKENPGKDGPWKEHLIARTGNIETTRSWDIDNDGVPEIVPNTPGKPLVIYRLKKGLTNNEVAFDSIMVINQHGHGLGCGDINGDGRPDLVIDKGWLECPVKPFAQPWVLHAEFNVVQASVPMLVTDVNHDGLNDIIIGQGHNYGLDWYEQRLDKAKNRTWIKHSIDPYNSQYHTMALVDIDNDGELELITGKRYRAHDDNDPGAHDPVGLYYYKWTGELFVKQVISYGSFGNGKGTGIFFAVEDLNGDNWKDIIVAGKDGLCVFLNKGPAK